ncbi:TonB-dependent receptor [Bacteroides heparinolyticus]|uniref:TonB-dependent receptor n=1 Tax=Prevotella heparinolytica TaxID=28113 RepID=UPI003FA0DDF2
MRKLRYILAGMALTIASSAAVAQTQAKDTTVNRTVIVEQEYNPDIMDASKINVLPQVEQPAASKKEVEYDATLAPAGNIPAGIMQVYGGKETQAKPHPGYVRLGHGNYGNLDVHANYLFALSDKDRLNLMFKMDGMNGKLKMPDNEDKWGSYYYRTNASVGYTHTFDKVDMDIAGKFGLSNFNFLPGSVRNKQKFTSGNVHFGVKSTTDDFILRFRAETNLLFYERQQDFGCNGINETIIRTQAETVGNISENQFVGVAFHMDNTFYNSSLLQNHHTLNFNPYYQIQNEDWKVRIGAHTDLAFGFGKKVRFAPDVTAQYTFSDSYTLYAQAKGGKLQNDFRRLESLHPYGLITEQTDATYEQLNVALGFKASPAPGVWLHLYGGYQSLKDDLMFFSEYDDSMTLLLRAAQTDTKNIYAGAEVNYSYKDLLRLTASGVYRNWSADGEEVLQARVLSFKPAFEADLRIDVRPVSSALVGIGYRHTSREKVEDSKVAAIGNLYLNGCCELFKGISVYARANNLLNKNYQYYWMYPAQGVNFVGGVNFQF